MERAAPGTSMMIIVGDSGFIVQADDGPHVRGRTAGFTTIGEAFQYIAGELDPMPPVVVNQPVVGNEPVVDWQARYHDAINSLNARGD
jgi:hypothetical protein